MRLVYAKIKGGNFGDDLNPWLWQRALPNLIDEQSDTYLFGIGTILRQKYAADLPPGSRKIVFGSGVGYGTPPKIDASWTIVGVRGPLSARTLELDPQHAISDAAMLVPDYLNGVKRQPGVAGFVPHHRTAEIVDWAAICAAVGGIKYIDPRQPPEAAMTQIASCDRIVSESLHGVIIADAFRVPWIPLVLNDEPFPFKWRDYCGAMGLRYRPVVIRPFLYEPAQQPFGKRLERYGKRIAARFGSERYRDKFSKDRSTGMAERDAVAHLLNRTVDGAARPFALSDDVVFSRVVDRLRTQLDVVRRLAR